MGEASPREPITTHAVDRSERSTAARAGIAQARGGPDLAAPADELQRPGPVPVGLVLPGGAEAGMVVRGPGETLASKDSGHLVREPNLKYTGVTRG
jgi:hypothetical protein